MKLRLFIVFFCTASSVLLLQSAFDSSDHRKAENAVRNYVVAGKAQSLGAYLEARAPGGVWSSDITHTCRGIVRVTYATQKESYEFDYDVPSHAIHPGNELGLTSLGAFSAGAGEGVKP